MKKVILAALLPLCISAHAGSVFCVSSDYYTIGFWGGSGTSNFGIRYWPIGDSSYANNWNTTAVGMLTQICQKNIVFYNNQMLDTPPGGGISSMSILSYGSFVYAESADTMDPNQSISIGQVDQESRNYNVTPPNLPGF